MNFKKNTPLAVAAVALLLANNQVNAAQVVSTVSECADAETAARSPMVVAGVCSQVSATGFVKGSCADEKVQIFQDNECDTPATTNPEVPFTCNEVDGIGLACENVADSSLVTVKRGPCNEAGDNVESAGLVYSFVQVLDKCTILPSSNPLVTFPVGYYKTTVGSDGKVTFSIYSDKECTSEATETYSALPGRCVADPTDAPTASPTTPSPTLSPTTPPTASPTTPSPTLSPTASPISSSPTLSPTLSPTDSPVPAPPARRLATASGIYFEYTVPTSAPTASTSAGSTAVTSVFTFIGMIFAGIVMA